MAGGGARADGNAIAERRRLRAIELIKQGLTNSVIAERLGARTAVINKIRKEVEAKAD